jgi:uncharacterized membrane protein YqiK
MSELPKDSLKALAMNLPDTKSLKHIHEEMIKYIQWINSKGTSGEILKLTKQEIDDLCERLIRLLQTPPGLDLIVVLLPSLIEISKHGSSEPPTEPEPALA